MDRVFSADEMSDQFWSPQLPKSGEPSMMNRSESEWAFLRFLQEHDSPKARVAFSNPTAAGGGGDDNDLFEIEDPRPDRDGEPSPNRSNANNVNSSACNDDDNISCGNTVANPPAFNAGAEYIPANSAEYQAYLKSKLDLACAAVALSRASYVISQESAGKSEGKGASPPQPGSQVPSIGVHEIFKSQENDAGRPPLGIPSLSATQKKTGTPVRSTTSGSSRELSDDDEAEGEAANTENMDPADVKRVRRMLSNRESARRSRRRKQAHLTELETQVAQLRVENSSLLKRLADITQQYNEAAVDNRVLMADVETLRAKVKMAEESLKRLTGLNPTFHAMSEISAVGIPPFDVSPSDTSADAAVPINDDQKFYQAGSGNPLSSSHDPRFRDSLAEMTSPAENGLQNGTAAHKIGRTASMQRVASLEHLQKRIRGNLSP